MHRPKESVHRLPIDDGVAVGRRPMGESNGGHCGTSTSQPQRRWPAQNSFPGEHACRGSSSPVEGRNAPYFSQLPLQSPLMNAQRHIGPQAFGMTVQRPLLRRRPLRAHPDAPHRRQGTCDSPCTPPQRGADLGLSHRLQSFRTAQNSSAGHLCAADRHVRSPRPGEVRRSGRCVPR